MAEETKKKSSTKIEKVQTKLRNSDDESSYDDEEYVSPTRSKSRGKEPKEDDGQPEDSSRHRRHRRPRHGRSRHSKRRRSRSRRRR